MASRLRERTTTDRRLVSNAKVVRSRLATLGAAARSGTNTMPALIEAVEAHATLGKISHTLRQVFSKHTEWTGV